MGYACPVCDLPQRDGEHLANHVAFTAMLHGDEHEAWLDERIPDWEGSTPAELAEAVTARAEETEYEDVFEDTVHDHDHDREHPLFGDERTAAGGGRGSSGFDAEAARRRGGGPESDAAVGEALSEARELTRRMREGDENGGDADADADGDGDASE